MNLKQSRHEIRLNTRFFALLGLLLLAGIPMSCTEYIRSSPAAVLSKSEKFLEESDTLGAIRYLENQISKGMDVPALYAKLGFLYRNLGSIRGRLESQLILEKGLRSFPDDKDLLMELGKTYYNQTFYPDAGKCFRRITELDSTMCEAFYFMGMDHLRKWLRNQYFKDELRMAYKMLNEACKCDSSRSDWLLKLAYIQYSLKEYSDCIRISKTVIGLRPDLAQPHFLIGIANLEMQRLENAWSEFKTALALTPRKEHYLDISILLDEKERSRYINSSTTQKEDIRRIFWITNDPDPTTEINERFMQHLARVFLADFYFTPPGKNLKGSKTDRGTALIKFGRPAAVNYSLESALDGRSETWIYTVPRTMVFIFQDEYLNDDFEIPIFRETMKYALHASPHSGTNTGSYIDIPGGLNCYVFKDNTMKSSAFVFLTLDADSLKRTVAPGLIFPIILRTSIFDGEWRRISVFNDTMLVDLEAGHGDDLSYISGPVTLPFGSYHLAMTAENEELLIRTTYGRDFSTLEYLSDSLTLSNIVLSSPLHYASGKPSMIVRGPFELAPLADRGPLNSTKLEVYFEIYNLRLRGLLSDYELSYQIFKVKQRPKSFLRNLSHDLAKIAGWKTNRTSSIAQTYQRSGIKHDEKVKTIINLDSLAPGDYILKVRVLDKISQQTSRRLVFFSFSG